MPARLLREGILDSEAVNVLTFAAEVFYRRLMSVVDDFGRFDGRPTVLRSRLYPLKIESVREADISRWIAECEKAGLIVLYAVGGKQYILFHKLGTPRAKESKYPAPPDGTRQPANAVDYARAQMKADESKPAQAPADAPYSGTGTDSGSGTGATSPPAPPGIPFDPLRHDQDTRKAFESRWHEAGLRKFSRLSASLQGRLSSLLADAWWAANYPAALAKAGQIPWLRDGTGRKKGAYDVSEFLFDPDECRKLVDGVYDPHAPAPTLPFKPPGKRTVADVIAADKAKREQKPTEGAA